MLRTRKSEEVIGSDWVNAKGMDEAKRSHVLKNSTTKRALGYVSEQNEECSLLSRRKLQGKNEQSEHRSLLSYEGTSLLCIWLGVILLRSSCVQLMLQSDR